MDQIYVNSVQRFIDLVYRKFGRMTFTSILVLTIIITPLIMLLLLLQHLLNIMVCIKAHGSVYFGNDEDVKVGIDLLVLDVLVQVVVGEIHALDGDGHVLLDVHIIQDAVQRVIKNLGTRRLRKQLAILFESLQGEKFFKSQFVLAAHLKSKILFLNDFNECLQIILYLYAMVHLLVELLDGLEAQVLGESVRPDFDGVFGLAFQDFSLFFVLFGVIVRAVVEPGLFFVLIFF